MNGLSMQSFIDLLDGIVDDVVMAATKDLTDPDVRSSLKQQLDKKASSLLGIDVNMPLVRPFWEKFTNGTYEQLLAFAGVAVSDPPESVDVAAEYVKEKAATTYENTNVKVDSIADQLKRRLAEKKAK